MKTSKYLSYQNACHRKYDNRLLSEKDFEWAVKLNRYSLQIIGLWPKSEQTAWEKRMCNLRALFISLVIIIFLAFPAVHSLIRLQFDILLVIDNLIFTLPIVTTVLRVAIFWWKKKAVASIINVITNDWLKIKSPQEEAIMIARAQIARIIVTFGYSLMTMGWTVIIVSPIFGYSVRYQGNITNPERLLPLQVYYIYDITKSPQYELTFIMQSISLFLCTMCYTGIDNFLSLSVFHISGQLDILRDRLLQLPNVTNYNDILKSCVMEHIKLLRAVDLVEDVFNIILLILFLYFGIIFAFYGFWITNILDNRQHLTIFHLAYIISIMLNTSGHMCMYCAVGEILTAQCDKIYYAVYFNKWYTLNKRNSRDLLLLMVKTTKPLYLNVGKLFPLTMATFCNLMKTSAGYISVLLTIRN